MSVKFVVDTVLEHTSFAQNNSPQGFRPVSPAFRKSKTQQMWESWSFIPDIQPNEVGPWEDVVTAQHHSDVRHQDILENAHNQAKPWKCCWVIYRNVPINLKWTLMQPTIVVVKAELYCVQSTVEYIRTNLQRNVTCCSILVQDRVRSALSQNIGALCTVCSVLPAYSRTHTLHWGVCSHPMMQERMNWLRKNMSDQPSYSTAWEKQKWEKLN